MTPSYNPETPIKSADQHYSGWVSFTVWARRATIAIIILLTVLGIALV